MKSIFCGNFEYDARQSDLERLFRRYGKVDRVDMKSGFAFVYMEDDRDAEDAIRALDRIEFGRKGRKLRVEWTKQERDRGIRRPEASKRASSNSRPSKTLFVINFDPYHTRTRDLERHFDPYGKILNVRIRKNFAFIQYESLEDAIKALDATNLSKLLDRVITVEFAVKDDDERRNGYSPDRARDRSPGRGYDRMRSPSPRRERGSPDYGHNKGRSPSPRHRERASPRYGHRSSHSPSHKESEPKYSRGFSTSPRNERSSLYNDKHNPDPLRDTSGNVMVHSPSPGKKATPDYGQGSSPSPPRGQRQRVGFDDFDHEQKPAYSDGESPPQDRYGSRSPVVRGRSASQS
ncbi:Arginine/serine-rich splicing factor 35 [Dorcoceras hygrometricum]|uniref:Arginine/serine-rich splicing factor 35 n=1 Tax=Dorcoceras hygrometricum TaxID=472368 RepID=A0A2Z7C2U6_9LAMI|nr:Arginine/serine-rich splicing factor 35 [Dorcoceras hygrometricum]